MAKNAFSNLIMKTPSKGGPRSSKRHGKRKAKRGM